MQRLLARAAPWVFALCLASPSALAQESAEARVLLDQGTALMRRGNFAEACPKLAESQRLAPSVAALVALGDCYAKAGKKASAWVTFREAVGAADAAGQAERARYARERFNELDATVARLTIEVSPAAVAPGLVITRNGVDVERAEWGSAIPMDPGPNEFVVTAPGKKPWRSTLTITADSRSESLVIPTLVDIAAPPKPAPKPAPNEQPKEQPKPQQSEPSPEASRWPAQKTFALVALGVGAAALGLGAVFGVKTLGAKSDANARCPTTTSCDAEGYELGQDAHRAATASTILFLAGGVAAGAGVVLWFTAPSAPNAGRVGLHVGPRSVGLEGAW